MTCARHYDELTSQLPCFIRYNIGYRTWSILQRYRVKSCSIPYIIVYLLSSISCTLYHHIFSIYYTLYYHIFSIFYVLYYRILSIFHALYSISPYIYCLIYSMSSYIYCLLLLYTIIYLLFYITVHLPHHNILTVAGHSEVCSTFEVGGSDTHTSIHLPLHRLLAGLTNCLPEGTSFLSPEFTPYHVSYVARHFYPPDIGSLMVVIVPS